MEVFFLLTLAFLVFLVYTRFTLDLDEA